MSKGTTRRTIRISDELWNSAQAVANENEESLSEVIRESLTEYVNKKS